MASRKEEKELRREARLAAEQQAEADARRKRLLAGAGVAALAAVVVLVGLIVVSQSGDDGGEVAADGPVPSEIDALPQDGAVLGDPRAEVSVIEFGDLQCPVCAEFARTVTPELVAGVVEAGEAKLEFKNFVILGPDSDVAARAALAAGEQDRLWQFTEVFYESQGLENSGYVTDEFLRDTAVVAGVEDLEAWERDRTDPRWEAEIAAVREEALDLGFNGTPSLLVEGPNGEVALGTVGSAAEIEAAIDEVR
jgi:protein-disulfide isomerase